MNDRPTYDFGATDPAKIALDQHSSFIDESFLHVERGALLSQEQKDCAAEQERRDQELVRATSFTSIPNIRLEVVLDCPSMAMVSSHSPGKEPVDLGTWPIEHATALVQLLVPYVQSLLAEHGALIPRHQRNRRGRWRTSVREMPFQSDEQITPGEKAQADKEAQMEAPPEPEQPAPDAPAG